MIRLDERDPLYSTKEAAEFLRCSAESIRKWRARGRFGPTGVVYVGSRAHIKRSALEAFADECAARRAARRVRA